MKKIAIILRRPPYGDINAAEAVRHALGAVSDDIGVSLVMLDAGTLLSRKGQDEGSSGYTNLGAALKDCLDMGVEVFAEKNSLKDECIEYEDMLEGVKTISASDAANLIQEADHSMIF